MRATIPKFKISGSLKLSHATPGVIGQVFGAPFEDIATMEALTFDGAYHKAYIEVDNWT